MIELYYADSGNSLRVVMLLEECGLPYKANKLDLTNGDQKAPEFLKINRFGSVPVIEDSEGPDGHPIRLSQSAAIMLYIANKVGKFIPYSKVLELKMMEWLLVAASDVGPANALILYMNRDVSDLSDNVLTAKSSTDVHAKASEAVLDVLEIRCLRCYRKMPVGFHNRQDPLI